MTSGNSRGQTWFCCVCKCGILQPESMAGSMYLRGHDEAVEFGYPIVRQRRFGVIKRLVVIFIVASTCSVPTESQVIMW